MSWQKEVDELRRREEMARRMGGPDKIKRQRDGGKLTVRERIERLLDTDSFHGVRRDRGHGGVRRRRCPH
jgi:acetyl-CoA carboxylase carboxyltransferase component